METMLFNAKTKRLSAVVDFDMIHISHPLAQFIDALFNLGGNLTYQEPTTCEAILSGSFEKAPEVLSNEAQKQWGTAMMFDRAMRAKGCLRPCEIKGAKAMLDLNRFIDLVCPFQLTDEGELTRLSEEKKSTILAQKEAGLTQWLYEHGY